MALAQGAKPLSIHKETTRLLRSGVLKQEPSWYQAVSAIPPSSILIRTAPVGFGNESVDFQSHAHGKRIKRSKRFFRPEHIHYPEDSLRKTFFADHPWELARPRILVEDTGDDSSRYDWSKLEQAGKALDGESVIQRQLWLMNSDKKIPLRTAYDIARKEFYKARMRSDIERRIAIEEAKSVGAYFGKTHVQVGIELEEQTLNAWKVKAEEELLRRQQRIEAITGPGSLEEELSEETPESIAEVSESKIGTGS